MYVCLFSLLKLNKSSSIYNVCSESKLELIIIIIIIILIIDYYYDDDDWFNNDNEFERLFLFE